MIRYYIYRLISLISQNWFVIWNKSSFKYYGRGSKLYKPMCVEMAENISIGDDVSIGEGTWLAANPHTGKKSELVIGRGTSIGHYNHIYATQSIRIGEYVLTADKVYISDNLHEYGDIHTPIIRQPIKQCKQVVIGDGAWIGENVCIIGACVGKQSVVGANSVVTHDIPDYCVATGAPARIIKRYDNKTKSWVKS